MDDRQKRIEERSKIISDICPFYKEYGSCDRCNTELDTEDPPCYFECMANAIINNGYRKQIVGEWYLEKETYGRMLCSNCREEALIKHEYNDERKGHLVYVKSSFCPNCGAKMTKGDVD